MAADQYVSLQILVCLFFVLVYMTFTLFICYKMITDYQRKELHNFFGIVIWNVIYAIYIMAIARSCSLVTTQSYKLASLVHKIMIVSDDQRCCDRWIDFSLLIRHNIPEPGFGPISYNWRLLYEVNYMWKNKFFFFF